MQDAECVFSGLLQASFECGALLTDVIMSRLLDMLQEMQADDMLSAVRHVLLYVHTLLDMQSQVRIAVLCALYSVCQCYHCSFHQNLVLFNRKCVTYVQPITLPLMYSNTTEVVMIVMDIAFPRYRVYSNARPVGLLNL